MSSSNWTDFREHLRNLIKSERKKSLERKVSSNSNNEILDTVQDDITPALQEAMENKRVNSQWGNESHKKRVENAIGMELSSDDYWTIKILLGIN
jgi:hypothetical protein